MMSLNASEGIFTVRGFNVMALWVFVFSASSRSFISLSNFTAVPFSISETVLLVVLSLRLTDNIKMTMAQYGAYCSELAYFFLDAVTKSIMAELNGAFASAFLMPKESVTANQPPVYTIKYLMKLKHYWGVSLAALAYRFNALGLVSEWNYRSLCIEIAKSGYRTNEPEPMERETSQLLTKVLDILHSRKQGRREIAESLCLSVDEINALTFQLTKLSVVSGAADTGASQRVSPKLRLV